MDAAALIGSAVFTALIATASISDWLEKIESNSRLDNTIAIAMAIVGFPLGPYLLMTEHRTLLALLLLAGTTTMVPWTHNVGVMTHSDQRDPAGRTPIDERRQPDVLGHARRRTTRDGRNPMLHYHVSDPSQLDLRPASGLPHPQRIYTRSADAAAETTNLRRRNGGHGYSVATCGTPPGWATEVLLGNGKVERLTTAEPTPSGPTG